MAMNGSSSVVVMDIARLVMGAAAKREQQLLDFIERRAHEVARAYVAELRVELGLGEGTHPQFPAGCLQGWGIAAVAGEHTLSRLADEEGLSEAVR
jgi:hypothetical protein